MALGEHFCELVAHTLAADGVNARGERANGALGFRLQIEAEPCREPNRTQHAQMVLCKAQFRTPDGAHHARIEISEAADAIDHCEAEKFRITNTLVQKAAPTQWAQRVEQQPVNREIAALHVLLGAHGVTHRIGMAAI